MLSLRELWYSDLGIYIATFVSKHEAMKYIVLVLELNVTFILCIETPFTVAVVVWSHELTFWQPCNTVLFTSL